ncbi:2-phospho-L-lactate guanylyltransferase [Nocardioides limicola]|uniref:2-phospho-L-lactate guanylyltransferase n=1 Tax=Nocardioides limicola TaxID=2803368 RepID=UPI00193B2D08|nr:2-phospho-L-lactate guanylyltransferase [Nocardioides sp. DJM-14]
MTTPGHVILLPVKPVSIGKSRLDGVLGVRRSELARAFALDTAMAARAASSVQAVLVVTDDHRFAAEFSVRGFATIPDGVAGDLNGTLAQAAIEAQRRWPGTVPVALCADLPALLPEDLDLALGTSSPSFVADADGVGTTMYAAPLDDFRPSFGPDSRSRHLAGGATEVAGVLRTLRRDVDDPAALQDALVLGVGVHTARMFSEPL